ncbi:MAG: glutamate racemase [Actinobacteria bacterium]|nr:glutamate racemase [Actinomycetota bacterium]
MDKRPIGIFDSGVGGLTVLREIMEKVPDEDLFYFGDTARFPYGTKNLTEVKSFAFKIADFLCSRDIKLLVVACNTASAAALDDLKKYVSIPVIGVIEPGAKAAATATMNKKIGVIATEGTVRSRAYETALKKQSSNLEVFSKAATLLVDYIERGGISDSMLKKAIISYIEPLVLLGIDVLILGCTHFPLIESRIIKCYQDAFKVISSAEETAKEVRRVLVKSGIENDSERDSLKVFFETGPESNFMEIGQRFLGGHIKEVIKVDLGI